LDCFLEPHLVAVTGLAFEARIVAGPGVTVVCGGGQLQLKRSIEAALRRRCRGILSFGIAGGLAAHLRPGSCIIARNILYEGGRYASHHGWAEALMEAVGNAAGRRAMPRDISFGDIAGSDIPLATAREKRMLHERTGAVAVDMESHVAARIAAEHRIPFAAFRVVTDPSERALPPAALVATHPEGTVAFGAILRSLIGCPAQVPSLVRIALDSWAARKALVPSRRFLGANLGLPDLREHLLDVA